MAGPMYYRIPGADEVCAVDSVINRGVTINGNLTVTTINGQPPTTAPPAVEDLTGQVGGSPYSTSRAYRGGSLNVYKNGVNQIGNITESNPATGQFTFVAGDPIAGHILTVSYSPDI